MIWLKIPYAQIAEWMCFITSILLLTSAKPKFWQYFIPYLAITVGVETYGYYTSHYMHIKNNHWMYNIFLGVYTVFHIFIFYKIIHLKHIKILSIFFLTLLMSVYFWEWQHQGFNHFFFRTNTLFGALITCLSILYFYNLFTQNNDIELSTSASFWFATACLIFYATSTCVNALFLEALKGSYLRYIIIVLLNLIMYSCWIKSFLCIRKAQNSI